MGNSVGDHPFYNPAPPGVLDVGFLSIFVDFKNRIQNRNLCRQKVSSIQWFWSEITRAWFLLHGWNIIIICRIVIGGNFFGHFGEDLYTFNEYFFHLRFDKISPNQSYFEHVYSFFCYWELYDRFEILLIVNFDDFSGPRRIEASFFKIKCHRSSGFWLKCI